MSPRLHMVPRRRGQGCVRDGWVACVEPAGDVRGANKRHQLAIVGTAFAKVAVEIDFHNLPSD